MKNIVILFSFFILSISTFGQRMDTIYVSTNNFIMLNFPTKIDDYEKSLIIDDVIGIKKKDNDLYIQALSSKIPTTNLMVKTIDGSYYPFILAYNQKPKKLNYFIEQSSAIKQGGKRVVDMNQKSNSIEERLIEDKGYLKIRNYIKNKGMTVVLKGIYSNNEKLYFLIEYKNSTNIPYNVRSHKFIVRSMKSELSAQEEEVSPIGIHKEVKMLNKETRRTVFVFNQFTIDENKVLNIIISEENGDRTLVLPIFAEIIDNSKKIK